MYFKQSSRRPKRSSYHRKLTDDKSLQDTMYPCAVCSFICDRKKVKSRSHKPKGKTLYADGNISYSANGTANTFRSLNSDTGTVTYTAYETVINGGCPNCGTPDSR